MIICSIRTTSNTNLNRRFYIKKLILTFFCMHLQLTQYLKRKKKNSTKRLIFVIFFFCFLFSFSLLKSNINKLEWIYSNFNWNNNNKVAAIDRSAESTNQWIATHTQTGGKCCVLFKTIGISCSWLNCFHVNCNGSRTNNNAPISQVPEPQARARAHSIHTTQAT